MTILMTKTELSSLTIRHLLEWIEALGDLANTPEWPFATLDAMAMQLEKWRAEFQEINHGMVDTESVKVLTYGEEVILICDEQRGEFIKLDIG